MLYLITNPRQQRALPPWTASNQPPNVAPKMQLPQQSQDQDQDQDQPHAPNPLLRPQLHSRKCHHTYNATRCLPRAVWVRSARTREEDSVLVYEVLLYYDHNRACTVYRTWDDFRQLRAGLGSWGEKAPTFCSMQDFEGVQRFLCEAVDKKGWEVAMEYFLCRRIDDCLGG
ncbi:hypothetical protein VP1G_09386 [Cytospora mali]|uniref:PX domain-containing protein n=1 Tax=Cytospora mali TaxID=578113 RepID=A0A194VE51_CYTMA|nr:hypothetical protein VP1G_09386 [Valsa mali var. pyri (nom. inval.)]